MNAEQKIGSSTDEGSDGSASRPFPNQQGNVDAFSDGIYGHESFAMLYSVCTLSTRTQHVECEQRQSMQKQQSLSGFQLTADNGYIREQSVGQDSELEQRERRQSAVENECCNDKLGSSLKNFELTAWGSNEGSNSDARRFGSEQSISAIVRSPSIVHYLLCLSSDLDWWSLHANTVCSARTKDFLPIYQRFRSAHRL